MSDSSFDAARAAGEYPPKGFGWWDTDKQKRALIAGLKNGEQWAIDVATYWPSLATERAEAIHAKYPKEAP